MDCNVQPYSGTLVPSGIDPTTVTWCTVWQLLSNLLGLFLRIAFWVAIVMTVIGGIYILTASDNEGRRKQGIGMIRAALIGIAIVLGANIILRGIFIGLGISQLPAWLQ